MKNKKQNDSNWIRTNFSKEDTLTFFKCFRGSGRQLVPTRMRKVPLSKYRNFLGKCWSGLEHLPNGCLFDEGTVEVLAVVLKPGRLNKMEEGRIFSKKLKIALIDKDHWP